MLNVEACLFVVDRVEADRPRFGPPPAPLARDDVERRKFELRCRICWLARREGAGEGGAGRELERDEARERLVAPMRGVKRLALDSGRSRATGVQDPSSMSDSSPERCGTGVRSWVEAGVMVSVELSWACSLRRES
jgi:hypothetical protein